MLAFGLGVSACGSGESEEPSFVGAGKLCGSVFSGDARAAVESAIGDTSFFATGDDKLGEVATGVKDLYADGQDAYTSAGELCVINGEKRGSGRMDISFGLYKPEDVLDDRHSADQRLYALGEQAVAGIKNSSLRFECVSPQLDGSDKDPARIVGLMSFRDPKAPETQALREDNLTVLHAASFALAKNLECENNGGLPQKAVLRPKPEPDPSQESSQNG
ncbi:hypothetical protein [Streptomyces lushanensis]|uniref:hypothetical protein n=1 Tax=Streptomyces lushanensis TaxID=1434255 RepID=UPI00114D100E|nr:hypothetical protein [Streptomyces lushanensis]